MVGGAWAQCGQPMWDEDGLEEGSPCGMEMAWTWVSAVGPAEPISPGNTWILWKSAITQDKNLVFKSLGHAGML